MVMCFMTGWLFASGATLAHLGLAWLRLIVRRVTMDQRTLTSAVGLTLPVAGAAPSVFYHSSESARAHATVSDKVIFSPSAHTLAKTTSPSCARVAATLHSCSARQMGGRFQKKYSAA